MSMNEANATSNMRNTLSNSAANSSEVKQAKQRGINYFNITVGIVGMLIACYGNLLNFSDTQKWCYLVGAILLLISSSLERQIFFIALQIIIAAGAAIAFAPIGLFFKAALPIILSVSAIGYFVVTGQFKDRLTALGCLGIAMLATGYAISNPIAYFLGALILMIYAFLSFRRGVTVAIIWTILNAVFAVTALHAVYSMIVV